MTALFRSTAARIYAVLITLLLMAPFLVEWFNQPFYLDLLSRILILSIAVVSLNLIMGYGGMVSLGHAAYLGIGAYCVGIPAYYGIYGGWAQLGLTILCSAAFALLTGALSLRTKGVYFIMITMAFSQMVFFTFVSMEEYGGDDGLVIDLRSEFPGMLNLENGTTLYYTILFVLLLCMYLVHKVVNSRFGRVIVGTKYNERRMQALGFETYRYRLVCYIISGVMCGIAGFLLGNFTSFISPEMMDWTRSGELIFMIVMGGTATPFGPLLGATVFIFLEEWLSAITIYWHLIFGILLILLVLFAKGGLHGLISRIGSRND